MLLHQSNNARAAAVEFPKMFDYYLQKYVLFSDAILTPTFFPYNLVLCLIGTVFGLYWIAPRIARFVNIFLKYSGSFLKNQWTKLKNTKEPFGLYGAALSSAMALLAVASFVRSDEDIELLLRCSRTNNFSADQEYVYISVNCAVKNSGDLTATIDAVEPTFYYSANVDLARGKEDRSYHTFKGDPSTLVGKGLVLPQTLQTGETKLFDTKVAIPIGWYAQKEMGGREVRGMSDTTELLKKF
jgi:hypothetical protein